VRDFPSLPLEQETRTSGGQNVDVLLANDSHLNSFAKGDGTPFLLSLLAALAGENYVDDSKMIREECGPTLWGTVTNWPDALDGANCVTARRLRWHTLLAQHKGELDAEFAKEFLGDQYEQPLGRINPGGMVLMARMELTDVPEIPGASAPRPFGANDGKVVTAALARNMSFWVRLGHPDGSPFAFGLFLEQHPEFAWQAPYLKDLVTNPWSLFKSKNAPGN